MAGAPSSWLFVIATKLRTLALTVKRLPGTVVNRIAGAGRWTPSPGRAASTRRDEATMTETSGMTATLKARLRADLTTAMKARDSLTTGTIRMALAAITNAEVSGTTAKELTDA